MTVFYSSLLVLEFSLKESESIIFFQEMWQLAIEGQAQGIFFLASLYTAVLCSYSLFKQIKTRYWPFVSGELVVVGIEKFGENTGVKSTQDYLSKALYQYSVSDVNYDGSRVSPWVFVTSHNAKFILKKQMSLMQHLPNGKVKIFYDPKNPNKSYLIIAGKLGIFITFLISISPLFLFYFKYYL